MSLVDFESCICISQVHAMLSLRSRGKAEQTKEKGYKTAVTPNRILHQLPGLPEHLHKQSGFRVSALGFGFFFPPT